jgi:hypothetical protein
MSRPRLQILKFTVAITSVLIVAMLSPAQDSGVSAGKRRYVPTGNEVILSGTITFTGKRPSPKRIDTSADPSCYEVNPEPETEWVVGNSGKLANVLLYVTSEMLYTYSFEEQTSPAVLEHTGCRYVPHVLGIRVDQPLMILNSDPTHHNTHPTPKNNPEWNQTQPENAPPLHKVFKRAEPFIPFKCNQHPWEKAYVGVFDHPFFAVSDESGNYRMEGLPPGQYTVVAMHELFGEKTIEVTLVPGEVRNLGFTFAAQQ